MVIPELIGTIKIIKALSQDEVFNILPGAVAPVPEDGAVAYFFKNITKAGLIFFFKGNGLMIFIEAISIEPSEHTIDRGNGSIPLGNHALNA